MRFRFERATLGRASYGMVTIVGVGVGGSHPDMTTNPPPRKPSRSRRNTPFSPRVAKEHSQSLTDRGEMSA